MVDLKVLRTAGVLIDLNEIRAVLVSTGPLGIHVDKPTVLTCTSRDRHVPYDTKYTRK